MMASMEIYQRIVRETKRRRKGRREWKVEIPNDVMEEIVMKLPVRSIMRFQAVSKHWESVIKTRDFGARHMAHQRNKDPKLMFVSYGFDHIRFEQRDLETTSLEERLCFEIEEINGPIEISECCDGLVCFYCLTQAVRVINTATETLLPPLPLANFQRLHKDHPDPDLERDVMVEDDGAVPVPFISFTMFGFGKDNVTGRYKIVWLYNIYPATLNKKKKTRCEVFDLEERRWRFVTTRPLDHHQILSNQRPPCANGLLYWLTGDEQGYPSTQTKLIVFDIHTEMFQVTSTPPFISPDASGDKIGLCNLDGRLCISELKGDCKQEFWWRVEECNKWERIFSVDLNSTSCWFGGITSQPLSHLWPFPGITIKSSSRFPIKKALLTLILILTRLFIICIILVTMAWLFLIFQVYHSLFLLSKTICRLQ